MPTLLCMAMFPKLVCAYGEYVDTGVNYGGHGNVPWNGDYGNVDVPSGNNVYVGSEVPRNAYGGYAQNSTVENNRLTIVGTHVGEAYGAYVRIQGDVSHNRVSVSGGSYVGGFVMGGQTDNGNAIDNHVVMTGSESMSALFGGFSYSDGVVQGNSVTMEDGIVGREVMGGYSYQGNAVGNVVVIRGGRVDMDVIGGASGHGNATDNQVVIAGAPVLMADVYGGSVETASAAAINNTVTLATDAGAHLENRTIYGGFRYLPGNQGTGDVVSGNTLNVEAAHVAVNNIANFEKVNFHLNHAAVTDIPVLELLDTGGTQLQGVTIDASGTIAGGGEPLANGTRIALVGNDNGIVADATLSETTGTLRQGVSLDYGFRLESDGQRIDAVLNRVQVNPGTGVFQKGRGATLGFLNEGMDFARMTGIANARELSESGKLGIYGAIGGSDMRQKLDKGGDADVSGTHLMLGVAGKLNPDREYDVLGSLYAEAGWGNIGSDNAYARGHGDTRYYGVGVIGRYQRNEGPFKGVYGEANAKIGRASTDFKSSLSAADGQRAGYDEASTYYGAGVGAGYLIGLASAYELDVSARYQWLRLKGYDTGIAGDPYRFDDIDSHRTRLGARLNYTADKQFTPYAGLAWEHEFSGTSRGSVYGYSLEENSLKGDTGIGKIGVRFQPKAEGPLMVDARVQGYVGQREGVAGRLVLNYLF